LFIVLFWQQQGKAGFWPDCSNRQSQIKKTRFVDHLDVHIPYVLSTNQSGCQTSGHLIAGVCALVVFYHSKFVLDRQPSGKRTGVAYFAAGVSAFPRVSWNVRLCIEAIGGLMVNFVIPAVMS
jgi:hypothetical protein